MLPRLLPYFIYYLFSLSVCLPVQAMLTNFTIDDSGPDPRSGATILYSPPTSWNTQSFCQGGPDPTKCNARPDVADVNAGTWHEGTFDSDLNTSLSNTPISATVRFNGTAVYIFCVLTGKPGFGDSDMTFTIDGDIVGGFTRLAPGLPEYEYNIAVYSNSSLPPGAHELNITNGRVGGAKSIIVLDKIIYSIDDPNDTPSSDSTSISTPYSSTSLSSESAATSPPTPLPTNTSSPPDSPSQHDNAVPHSTPPGIIIGAVLGSLAVIIILVASIILYRRYQRPFTTGNDTGNGRSAHTPGSVETAMNDTGSGSSFPIIGDAEATAHARRVQTQGWVVASDSKQTIMRTAMNLPPAYRSVYSQSPLDIVG